MNIVPLTNEEQIKTDCQFKVIVKYTDFNSTAAATAQTINLFSAPSGSVYTKCLTHIITPFVGGGLTAYGISVGFTGGGNVAALNPSNAVFGAVTGFAYASVLAAQTNAAALFITATATPGTAACSAATAGEVHFYIQGVTLPLYNI